MAQVKMKYGIDLGTTNSAICKMENGEPSIKKTDTLKDTLPSCVSFTRRKVIKVGDTAYADLRSDKSRATKKWKKVEENVFIEFKRTMGLEKQYEPSNMGCSYNSEDLSSEVLKTLKSFVSEDNINACVITIPAKFKVDQIAATKRAAELAGIQHSVLLQEPIAASMAYGLSTNKKDGIWLVFDFGGGTFDAALLKVEDGIMQVKDTEGDGYLGGKNLDYAVVDEIIIPYLRENYVIDDILEDPAKKDIIRNAMKYYAEQAKNQLSFKEKCDVTSQLDEFGEDDGGTEIELDMIITQEQIEKVVAPIFQKAIDICKKLLSRNNISGNDLDTLILVGGPTYSPVLRQMLKEQITPNVDTSIDPMTAVAKGAALYASGIGFEPGEEIQAGTIVLNLDYASNSVELMECVAVKLLAAECKGQIPSKIHVEFTRNDKGWSSGKVEINEIGEVVECQLMTGKANSFLITAYDDKGMVYPCFPNEITILQGFVGGDGTLSYNMGIEAHDSVLDKDAFFPFKGLEKNQPLIATGVRNGFKTPKQLRPGMSEDRLIIPIYQGEFAAEGSNAIYNDHVTDVIITGDDVPALIPKDSDIDITIKVDKSQMMTVEVYFPSVGESIERKIDVKARSGVNLFDLDNRLDEAKQKLKSLESANGVTENEILEAKKMLNDVINRYDGEKLSEDGKMHLLVDLRLAFLEIEKVEKTHEWESLEAELKSSFNKLEEANNDLGNKYDEEVTEQRKQTDAAIRKRDMYIGHQVVQDNIGLFVRVTMIFQLISFVRDHSSNFNSYRWKDAGRARQLLNQAQQMISDGPEEEQLHPLVCSIIDLLDVPASEKPKF